MFAGLISREQPVSAWGDVIKIMAALAPYSLDKPRDVWVTDQQLLLQVATRTDSTTAEIYRHPESGVAVAFWGRLDNRPDLIQQLEAQHKAIDDELIALAWLKWGEHCPEKLIGDFTFAVSSPKTKVVFLARDVMGIKPLFYRVDDNGVFFANTAAAFKPLRLGTLTRSREWMAKFLVYLSSSHTETAYEEIKKLPGAHCLLINSSGQIKIRKYHQFQDNSPWESKRNPEWLEAYKEVWRETIACRIPEFGNIGSENSGGIDSGSITAELACQLGDGIGRLTCFGYCREELEPEMIMATAMKYGIHRTILSSRPYDYRYLESVLERSIVVNGYPIEMGVAEDHSHFYSSCQQLNIGTLFSGFGGDEMVTQDAAIGLTELLDRLDYLNVFRMTKGSFARRVYRTGKLVAGGYRIPRIRRSEVDVFQQRMQFTFFTDEIEFEFGLTDAFIHQNDMGQEFRMLNSMALFDLSRPYVPTRLENCTLVASSFGVEYVWPLLDRRLIQQWLSTPTIWKIGDGWVGRYLHRCAVDGTCPDKVTWKSDKNMGSEPILNHFDQRCNRDFFVRLLNLADGLPASVASVVDASKLRRVALRGIKEDARGYEVFSAMVMLEMNLKALVSWREV